jgi:hypothetical protein
VHITRDGLEGLYEALRGTKPFCRWGLPPGKDVTFSLLSMKNTFGTHTVRSSKAAGNQHEIAISVQKHGRLSFLASTMAHEMCHLKLGFTGNKHGEAHGEAFMRLAAQVCRYHRDFDPEIF